MTEEELKAKKILQPYRKFINNTPVLLSLLYDVDLLPEQIVTTRGALSTIAVVWAYKEGFKAGRVSQQMDQK